MSVASVQATTLNSALIALLESAACKNTKEQGEFMSLRLKPLVPIVRIRKNAKRRENELRMRTTMGQEVSLPIIFIVSIVNFPARLLSALSLWLVCPRYSDCQYSRHSTDGTDS